MPMARAPKAGSRLAGEALYEYALRALARRSHTSDELQAKLHRRCASEEDVEGILSRLRSHGYLDDERVAESHSAFRRDVALVGQKRVLVELRRRGVAASLAERAVAEAYGESDESEIALEFLRRKLGSRFRQTRIQAPKEILRLYRALVRAGFRPSAIDSALRAVSSNDGLLDQLYEATAAADPFE